jgi:hypothetical protein
MPFRRDDARFGCVIASLDVGQRKMAANISRMIFWSAMLVIAATAVALLSMEISGFRYLLSD